MDKFIKRFIFFSLILGAYLGTNFLINKTIFSQSSLPIKDSNIYIMGDSHTRKALNPKLFNSAVNISQQAEFYILTYWKLKYILKSKKIDTLLVSFAPHNFSSFNDRKFEDEKWSSEMFERVYLINDFENLHEIPVDQEEFYKTYFFRMLLYPNFNHATFIGNHLKWTKNNPFDSEKVINKHFYKDSIKLNISEVSIKYLEKIIALSKENNIELYLVTTPVHKIYYDKIPKNYLDKFHELSKKYSAENVKIIDYMQHDYEDKYFYNSDHLNDKGATKFTNEIITILKKK